MLSQVILRRPLLRVKAWCKYLGDREILAWSHHGVYKLKVDCVEESKLREIPCGSLVEFEGEIVAPNTLCVKSLRVLHSPLGGVCIEPEEFTVDPLEFARSYYKYVKHPQVLRSILTYFVTTSTLRSYLLRRGFVELPPPIIGHVSDPGLRGAKKAVIELYGGLYEVQSSVIMYKQLYASVLERVFYVARNLRIEPVENAYTGRHLVEFTQVDVEVATTNAHELVELGERSFYYVVKTILDKHWFLLSDRDIERLEREVSKPPYPKVTYDEALEKLVKMGFKVKSGEELPFDAEAALADKYGSPIWLIGFPSMARGFYYLEDPSKPGYNVDYNLILPSGHGEVLDGGCREYRYEKLVEKIASIHKEPVEKYRWFLELVRGGEIRPTCGWGVGVERLVKYILNFKHIVYATPHPRLPGVIGP
ncbi:MAG: asparagine synthetase A [Desulfurococcaceae archaeon]|nr:asparagine synthetase A [Desulfurococcaceae archaeon]